MNVTPSAPPPRVPAQHPVRPDPVVPLFLAFGALVIAFVVYQAVGAVAMAAGLLLGGTAPAELLADLEAVLADNPVMVLTANAVGQFVGLALVALVAARLHTRTPLTFLRMRTAPPALHVVVAVVGVIALIPLVQVLAGWNSLLPLPGWLEELEASREALLAALLSNPTGWLLNLLLVALTPAICEEMLFRGYFQGQLERIATPLVAVALSGIVFGAFHLVPTQLLPLSVLGVYMAYVVWRTGSLWTGIAVHLAHNGLMVLLAPHLEGALDAEAAVEVPVLLTLGATGVAGALIFWLHKQGARGNGTADASPNVYSAAIHSLPEHPHER